MKNKKSKIILILILTVISVLFIAPIVIVFMNSFKSKLFINSTPPTFSATRTNNSFDWIPSAPRGICGPCHSNVPSGR